MPDVATTKGMNCSQHMSFLCSQTVHKYLRSMISCFSVLEKWFSWHFQQKNLSISLFFSFTWRCYSPFLAYISALSARIIFMNRRICTTQIFRLYIKIQNYVIFKFCDRIPSPEQDWILQWHPRMKVCATLTGSSDIEILMYQYVLYFLDIFECIWTRLNWENSVSTFAYFQRIQKEDISRQPDI